VSTFRQLNEIQPHILRAGVMARAVTGDRVTLAVVDLEPKALVPEHKHENEQLGIVISGTITMRVGSDKLELSAGDTYAIPATFPTKRWRARRARRWSTSSRRFERTGRTSNARSRAPAAGPKHARVRT